MSTGWTPADYPGPSCMVSFEQAPGLLDALACVSRMSANVTWSRQVSIATTGKKPPKPHLEANSCVRNQSGWEEAFILVTGEEAEEESAGSSAHPCTGPLPICLRLVRRRLPSKSVTVRTQPPLLLQTRQLQRGSPLLAPTDGCLLCKWLLSINFKQDDVIQYGSQDVHHLGFLK